LKKLEGRRRAIPMPQPKPGEKPKPKQKPDGDKPAKDLEKEPGKEPGDKPSEKPAPEGPQPGDDPEEQPEERPQPQRIPIPGPGHAMPLKKPMPEICKKHFEKKRGYANFYFNKLNRDRVWKAWTARGDFSSLGGAWSITGPLEGGGTFRCELTATDATLTLPVRKTEWKATDELHSSLLPAGSGGLMPALHLWRRLAVEGPDRFGQVTYLGTAPLAGREGLADVLAGIHGGVECRFYFDPREGDLVAIEMFPEDHVDPCEIYFSEHRQVDGRMVPGRMEVRIGNDLYGIFVFEEVQLGASGDGDGKS